LIGAGTSPTGSYVTALPGASKDVEMLARVLRDSFGVLDDDIDRCVDDGATADAMRERLQQLREATGPDDTAFVYFTGHSVDTAGADDAYLIGYDDHTDGLVGITPTELAAALQIPAREVVLVLDTHVARSFLDLIESQRFEDLTVLLACGVGEMAYEMLIDGEQHGLFTASLSAELADSEQDVTYGELVEAVRRRVESNPSNPGQTPQHLGPVDGRLFAGRFPLSGLWAALRRRMPRQRDEVVLRRAIELLDDDRARWALGRLALASGDIATAASLCSNLARVDQTAPVHLDVALSALARGDSAAAAESIRLAAAELGGDQTARLNAVAASLVQPPEDRPLICIVAPSPELAAATHQPWVDELASSLADAFDRDVSDVEVLSGPAATVDATRALLRTCSDPMSVRTAILVFDGSIKSDEGYHYQLTDGSLSAADVRTIVGSAFNLVVMLKAAVVVERDLAAPPPAPVVDDGFDAVVVTSEDATLRALISRLRDVWDEHRTYGEWTADVSGAALDPPSMANQSVRDSGTWAAARAEILRVQRASAEDAAGLARSALDRREAQHEEHPAGHLQLGLALEAAGRTAEALVHLRTARNLYDDTSVNVAERASDPSTDRWHLEARFHYGRLQYEHGDDLYDAVAALQAAQRGAPDDPRLLLHLSRAIKTLIERETLVEARRYARRYLELGAPLGGAAELREFIARPQT
jgi:hypothetical protein